MLFRSLREILVKLDIPTLVATIASGLFIAGAIITGIRWLLKNHTESMMKEYLVELKPNHGTSLNDAIVKQVIPMLQELRENQVKIANKVAKLEGRFEQHVEESAE